MKEFVKATSPAPSFPELATDRLLLCEFRLDDVPAVFNVLRCEFGTWRGRYQECISMLY